MKKLSLVPVSCVFVSREPERGVCVCDASQRDSELTRHETQQRDAAKGLIQERDI